MARSNVAQTQNTERGETSAVRGARARRTLLGSLPLAALVALMALLIMPATVMATVNGPAETLLDRTLLWIAWVSG